MSYLNKHDTSKKYISGIFKMMQYPLEPNQNQVKYRATKNIYSCLYVIFIWLLFDNIIYGINSST